jgi:alpha-glucuronidase
MRNRTENLGWLAVAAALALGCSESNTPGSNPAVGGGGGAPAGGVTSAGGAGAAGAAAAGAGAGNVAGGGTGGSPSSTGGMVGATEPYPIPEPGSLADEDGSSLWLRYPQLPIPMRLGEYRAALTRVVSAVDSPSIDAAEAELVQGLSGLTGNAVTLTPTLAGPGAVVIGTASSAIIKDLALVSRLAELGPEGYLVETAEVAGQQVIAVAANTEVGVLYGSFALLRHLQRHSSIASLALAGSPRIKHRLLNHWDNLDGSVERGYAGTSIWGWGSLPGSAGSARFKAYARANASIGINGTVLTNVNASAQVLTAAYLTKVKALADVFRPYGIKVYLTARFSAPQELGGLATSDPLNAGVRDWWADKVDEIYAQVPDFGGFVVKANSEGQPGPQDYGRSHADGANMLAEALDSRGIVMWRAFVYSDTSPPDRIKQAYEEFQPLDGEFDASVLVQVKNGPLDFQPREPFHPLFGAMPQTPLALELQITKEYLGQDTHLAYLGPLYQEVLRADTQVGGVGTTVARVVDGTTDGHALSAIAGVANIGSDANWSGSHMNQANWYVFGRLAWDPDLEAGAIADEWVRQTFSNDPAVVEPVVQMLMSSRQTLVSYMTPLGLAHIMGSDHHYGPGPWLDDLARAEWNPVYYHRADAQGIGFDRTASGSNAVAQYSSAVGQAFGARATVPDDLLLFFHRVGWQEQLPASGRSLWQELVHRYSAGVDGVASMRQAWMTVQSRIDARRFDEVAELLQTQHYEARWWRDACLAYFSDVSGLPIPSEYAMPTKTLAEYITLETQCPPNVTKPRCSQVYVGDPSPAILE